MKKLVVVLAIFFTAYAAAAQQNQSLSFSTSRNSHFIKHLGNYSDNAGDNIFWTFVESAVTHQDLLGNLLDNEYDWVKDKSFKQKGQFNIDYSMAVGATKRVRIGAGYTTASFSHSKKWYSGRTTSTQERFSSVMATTSVAWYRNNWLELSSGIGLGLTQQRTTGYINENLVRPAAQLSPIKATVYTDTFGVFIEPGLGAKGINGGFSIRF